MFKNLLYVIPAAQNSGEELVTILKKHPEVKFVSPVGIDLLGNDTDAKVPIGVFLKDMKSFFDGSAIQTDGSSVNLEGLVTINNAKIDMMADTSVNWFVDYNYGHLDEETKKPVGTLRIPCFLLHEKFRVDSRSILAYSMEYVKEELLLLCKNNAKIAGLEHIDLNEIEDIVFTVATELEFWVKTPADKADVSELSASQVMHEQYWQRTRGHVRSALEQTLLLLDKYGLEAEMGHKEVGGVKSSIDNTGNLSHVMEQVEVTWKYTTALQAADNELLARIIVREVFRMYGLEVVFKAKPIIGVAGNGKHTHVGIAAKLKSGELINLFAPEDMKKYFMSSIGYGAIMGILKNYEVINPFISSTNDSFNRLKPGFEAPVCIVTSLGHSPALPSRNRTILAALIREIENPLATRFEVRSPNPYTNTYLAVSAIYLSMLDGIKASMGKTIEELHAELSKDAGTEGFYLERDRAYRSEHDVFEYYTQEERDKLFGKHPATVWENMQNIEKYRSKLGILTAKGGLRPVLVNSFAKGALLRWKTELITRIIPETRDIVKECKPIHEADATSVDLDNWEKINAIRICLAKDGAVQKSIFTQIEDALLAKDFSEASRLQLEMAQKTSDLKNLYIRYTKNMIHI
jgi:glutamine synthetase